MLNRAVLWVAYRMGLKFRERSRNHELCITCAKIIQYSDDGRVTIKEILGHPFEKGCPLCFIVLSELSVEEKDKLRPHEDRSVPKLDSDVFSTVRKVKCRWRHFWGVVSLEYTIGSYHVRLRLKYIPAKDISSSVAIQKAKSSTASFETLNIAKIWLEKCRRRHGLCMKQALFIPTRLIDVSVCLKPRLCEGKELEPTTKYMTLSHCWGQHLASRLVIANYKAMKQDIPLNHLPKTFRDAIAVTRYFGIRYLWIDALCIIQDSAVDWAYESARMYQVYSCSECNISATAASDGSKGLFFERDPRVLQRVPVKIDKEDCYLIDQYLWTRNVDEAPLNSRAWVTQERLLSPRNLHFTSTQLFWECNQLSCCESFPAGFPPQIMDTTGNRMIIDIDGPIIRNKSTLPQQNELNAYAVWGSIVERYSGKELTIDTDRLVALSGLAARIQTTIDDEYLAGLWRKHLASQLLWFREYRAARDDRPKTYIAPSWSWASNIGVVCQYCKIYDANERDILIDILDVKVELTGINPYGSVKGGCITLQGSLLRIIATALHSEDGEFVRYHASILADCILSPTHQYIRLDFPNTSPRLDSLYCLPVRNNVNEPDYNTGRPYCFSGLLLELTGDVPGQYRRVGVFTSYVLYSDTLDYKIIQAGFQFFDSKAAESGLEYCDDGKGGYKYTITII